MGSTKKNKRFIPDIIIIFTCFGLVGVACFSGYFNPQALFNSDALYIPEFVTDVFSNKGRATSWHPPPATYYFPDTIIFSIAYLLGSNAFYQVVISAVIQTIITFCIIWYLAAKTVKQNALSIAAIILAALVWIALLRVSFSHQFFATIFSHIFVLSFHYGSFISLLLFIALWQSYEDLTKNHHKIIVFIVICLVSLLTGASDKLFLAHAALAFFVTRVSIDLINRDFSLKRKFLSFIPVVCAVLGSVLYEKMHPNAWLIGFPSLCTDVNLLWLRISTLFNNLFETITIVPIFGFFLFLYLLVVAHAFYNLFMQRDNNNIENKLRFLTILSFFSVCAAVSTALLFTISEVGVHVRYMMPLFFFPIIIPILYFGFYFGHRFANIGLVISSIAVISLCYNVFTYINDNKDNITKFTRFPIYTELFSCIEDILEKTDARDGVITDYWPARPFKLLSKLNLNIALHSDHGFGKVIWISSEQFYRNEYDFIIMNLSFIYKGWYSDLVLRNKNKATYQKACGPYLYMLVYSKEKLKLNELSSNGVQTDKTFFWKACEFAVGLVTDECNVEIKSGVQSQPASVRFPKLLKGKYSVSISYSSPENSQDIIGNWVVITSSEAGNSERANNYILGANGETKSATGEFSVDQDYDEGKVEMIIFPKENKTFTINHLLVTKLD